MGRKSGWWDNTWNPFAGCSHASPGCRHCYAQQLAGTQQTARRVALYDGVTDWHYGQPIFNGKLSVLPPAHPGWSWPLKWSGAKHPVLGPGEPSLIFIGDMADLFHEDRPVAVVDQVAGTIAASRHIGLILTKRADRMAAYFTLPRIDRMRSWRQRFWLGVSTERQQEFDQRWPPMRELSERGWMVYVAVAPILGPIVLPSDLLALGNRAWVIVSGEQGRDARDMHPSWARAIHDQCIEAGVPFFMNQMSGRTQIPAGLFVRKFPTRDQVGLHSDEVRAISRSLGEA